MRQIFGWIRAQELQEFSVPCYLQGLEELLKLHQSLSGII